MSVFNSVNGFRKYIFDTIFSVADGRMYLPYNGDTYQWNKLVFFLSSNKWTALVSKKLVSSFPVKYFGQLGGSFGAPPQKPIKWPIVGWSLARS